MHAGGIVLRLLVNNGAAMVVERPIEQMVRPLRWVPNATESLSGWIAVVGRGQARLIGLPGALALKRIGSRSIQNHR